MNQVFSPARLLSYGFFGLPLALVALPVYVYVPQFYSSRFGLSLTLIGALLLVARVLDAFLDPAIGAWMDRMDRPRKHVLFIACATPLLSLGFVGLFHPPTLAKLYPLPWLALCLGLVYAGFSAATIAHQSWGAALTQQRGLRNRLSALREACGLAGVMAAAVLPQLAGMTALTLFFIAMLAAGLCLLLKWAPAPCLTSTSASMAAMTTAGASPRDGKHAGGSGFFPAHAAWRQPRPALPAHPAASNPGWTLPFSQMAFRWLIGVFALNGIAAAIPATLFLFFVDDRLALGKSSGLFLLLYFASAALALPLWSRLAFRHGESRAWIVAMLLAVGAFLWTAFLPAGATLAFGLICMVSGFALGADLALPPALLAAVIAGAGHSARREGAYFGIWSWVTKMNLALAAGIALPLLDILGYVPGTSDTRGSLALTVVYACVPCVFKLAAAGLLWRSPLHQY